jgi:hypothetical protein
MHAGVGVRRAHARWRVWQASKIHMATANPLFSCTHDTLHASLHDWHAPRPDRCSPAGDTANSTFTDAQATLSISAHERDGYKHAGTHRSAAARTPRAQGLTSP